MTVLTGVCVLLLFYVHCKHLWSCRDSQLTKVGKKAGNTHNSQDGGNYWEIGYSLTKTLLIPLYLLTAYNYT